MSPESERKSHWKNPLIYTSSLLVIALLYVGYTFYSRRQENRAIEQKAAAQKLEEDRKTVEMLGGKELDIQQLYATPAIRRGEKAQLCYGVANAKTVKLEPPAGPMWPSYARCIDVSPTKSTTYTLTAEDGAGHSKSQSVDIKVR